MATVEGIVMGGRSPALHAAFDKGGAKLLELRLLGEMEVIRDGERLALPPSRKTRALLAYLIATGRPHRRERLCSLLWEVPDDPRGALRWSLSRLRPLVDEPDGPRIVADRESVRFEPAGASVDLADLRRAAQSLDRLSLEDLRSLADRFRGEFLEGMDLPDLYDFHAWCLAEREDVRRLHARTLTVLSERLLGEPEQALPHVRRLVQVDPYDASARALLLQHLVSLGRQGEAEQHFETGMRILREVGTGSEFLLLRRWRELRGASGSPRNDASVAALVRPATPVASPPRIAAAGTIVGREAELHRILARVDAARADRPGVLLVVGEPGLGKTRLVEEVADSLVGRDMSVFIGRAHEADRSHPYGAWVDALGEMATRWSSAGDETSGPAASAIARDAMFAAAGDRIFRAGRPALVIIDDAHWCDDASADLLHFLLRTAREVPLTVMLAARDGELADNAALLAVLRGYRHQNRLDEIRLEPLSRDETERLLRTAAPSADASVAADRSKGNPLFALELARSDRAGEDDVPRSLKDMVRQRVDRLPAAAGEVLRWASGFGSCIDFAQLTAVVPMEAEETTAALDLLERHAFLRASASGQCTYAFAHQLVRNAVYTTLSEPRRRLMHLKIAQAIAESGADNERTASDLAHHAILAGDPRLAASACVRAARRCLRLFAHSEAAALVRRGVRFAGLLPEREQTERMIELLEIELRASKIEDAASQIERIERLANRALDLDLPQYARLAFHMLGYLRWLGGLWSDAHRDTLRAEIVSRSTDTRERVVAMAEAARCLAMLERDLPQADALLLEASALARRVEAEPNAMLDAQGLLRLHQGNGDEAAALFRRARFMAQCEGERTSEFFALEHLADLELSRGRYLEAESIAADMIRLGAKLPAGSELASARAVEALCRLARNDAKAAAALEAAIEDLRVADAKHRLCLVLRHSAAIHLDRGAVGVARRQAEEALGLAEMLDRPSDVALARVAVIHVVQAAGDAETEARQRALLVTDLGRPLSQQAISAASAESETVAGGRAAGDPAAPWQHRGRLPPAAAVEMPDGHRRRRSHVR